MKSAIRLWCNSHWTARNHAGIRCVAVLLLACAVFAASCSAQDASPDPSDVPGGQADTPESGTAAVPVWDIPGDTTWHQLISTVSSAREMACIEGELGDALPADLLGITVIDPVRWPVVGEELLGIGVGDDRWPHELWQCLAPETAAAVYLSVFAHEFGFAIADGGALAPEIEECLASAARERELVQVAAAVLNSEQSFENADLAGFMDELDLLALEFIEECVASALDDAASGSSASQADANAESGSTAASTCQEGSELTAEEIYERVAPSIVYIETPGGSGSGILIDGGYVLTNHHVLWPFDFARIVFADGTEYSGVPLSAANPWVDIALVGPLETSSDPLELADGEYLPPGSDVYLVGYPAEYEYAPEPTITRGVLSRVRHWEGYDHTLLQTDSAITGGQSGGALIDSRGCVIGVSTWSWTDANFALSTSASDNAELIGLMLGSDGYTFSIVDRLGDHDELAHEHQIDITDGWERPTYVAISADEDDIYVELQGPDGAGLWIADSAGLLIDIDDALPRHATVTRSVAFVEIVGAEVGSTYTLSSNVEMVPYYDEDGVALEIGGSNAGFFDYYGDEDVYTIELQTGDVVRIWTDSVGADTYLTLYDQDSFLIAEDDDSGPVTLPEQLWNAEIWFEAPQSGTYYIDVGYHPELSSSQSYLINVEAIE